MPPEDVMVRSGSDGGEPWRQRLTAKALAARLQSRGRMLPQPLRGHVESLLGYDLRDLRVHDYHQATEVASRVGAAAVTYGGNVFLPRQALGGSTPTDVALLAHEAVHVVQQTARPSPLPLARQSLSAASARAGPPSPQLARANGDAETRAVASGVVPGGDEREAAALATERGVLSSLAHSGSEKRAGEAAVQPAAVADQVYRLMRRELKLLRERAVFR